MSATSNKMETIGDEGKTEEKKDAVASENKIFTVEVISGAFTPMRKMITVIIFCFVNLIHFMDRYSVAAVLVDIQCEFQIGDTEGGLLQTVFVIVFIITAPFFGYLGDRFSRIKLMAIGIFLWSLFGLISSYVTSFGPFIAMRALVGIGEASYYILAPAMISDLYVGNKRSNYLALFLFTIPFGSGVGFVVGSTMSLATGTWHWGIRLIPIIGFFSVFLILLLVQDPPRGSSEGAINLSVHTWWSDMKFLSSNKSFLLTAFATMTASFVLSAAAWWGPKFITLGVTSRKGYRDVSPDMIPSIFGLIGGLTGLIGVPLGSLIGQKIRTLYPKADPIVCGSALLLSFPLLMIAIFTANVSSTACFIVTAFGILFMNMIWGISADILMYTVGPSRRATAGAFQGVLVQLLGSAASPFIIGVISEGFKNSIPWKPSPQVSSVASNISSVSYTTAAPGVGLGTTISSSLLANVTSRSNCSTINSLPSDNQLLIDANYLGFLALQYALVICIFVQLFGALCFFLSVRYIEEDKAKALQEITEFQRTGNSETGPDNSPVLNTMVIFPSSGISILYPSLPILEDDELPGKVKSNSAVENKNI